MFSTGACAILAALVTAAQPRMYQAEATLEVQEANEDFLNRRDISPALISPHDSATSLQTQAEMLQQDALIAQTAAALRLQEWREFQDGSSEGLLHIGHPLDTQSAVWRATQVVKKHLTIAIVPTTHIIRVIFRARDPKIAAAVANNLSEGFIEQGITSRRRVAEQVHAELKRQLAEIRDRLDKSESRLEANALEPAHGQRYLGASSRAPHPGGPFQQEMNADLRFYETLSQRVNEARMAAVIKQPTVRVLSPAHTSTRPVEPNLPLNLAIGSFGGLLLAVGLTTFQEQTYSLLRLPGEATKYLRLPELGAIPQLTARRIGMQRLPGLDPGGHNLESGSAEQMCVLSESFRATLASILSAGHGNERARTIVVTSSRPMEGKTTVVSNLGTGLAEIGRKVLLIDADTRRPRLHEVFNQANSWGLSNILAERNAVEDLPVNALVKKTDIPNLYLLPSGCTRENVFALLWSGRMARLFPRFLQEFEYILLDAPPCLEFADARVIARYTDQLVLVVRANVTDRRSVRSAVQRLTSDGLSVMGVILNGCDPESGDFYGYDLT